MSEQSSMAETQAAKATNAIVGNWVSYSLEGGRWLIGSIGFFVALWFGHSTAEMLHLWAPFLLLALAGMSGVEDVLFCRYAPTLSGREPSPYQRQSGFNNLALAGTGLLSFVQNWGAAADVALLTVLLISSTLSAVSHFGRAVKDGEIRVRSYVRVGGTVGLLFVLGPMLIGVAQTLAV